SVGIAEPRNRFAPVFVVAVGAALLTGNLLAIQNQTRTAGTGNNFGIENFEPGGQGHFVLIVFGLIVCAAALAREKFAADHLRGERVPYLPRRQNQKQRQRPWTRVSAPHDPTITLVNTKSGSPV